MSFQKINLEDTTRTDEKVCILAYGYNPNEVEVLKKYCVEQTINNVIVVNDVMTEMSMEDIINEKQIQTASTSPINAKIIIMNGFSGSDLKSFLNNFKSTGLERPIFATVTPTSKSWTFKSLVKELIKEHEMMKNRNKKVN